jgi:hypothetical protein
MLISKLNTSKQVVRVRMKSSEYVSISRVTAKPLYIFLNSTYRNEYFPFIE